MTEKRRNLEFADFLVRGNTSVGGSQSWNIDKFITEVGRSIAEMRPGV